MNFCIFVFPVTREIRIDVKYIARRYNRFPLDDIFYLPCFRKNSTFTACSKIGHFLRLFVPFVRIGTRFVWNHSSDGYEYHVPARTSVFAARTGQIKISRRFEIIFDSNPSGFRNLSIDTRKNPAGIRNFTGASLAVRPFRERGGCNLREISTGSRGTAQFPKNLVAPRNRKATLKCIRPIIGAVRRNNWRIGINRTVFTGLAGSQRGGIAGQFHKGDPRNRL